MYDSDTNPEWLTTGHHHPRHHKAKTGEQTGKQQKKLPVGKRKSGTGPKQNWQKLVNRGHDAAAEGQELAAVVSRPQQ